MPTTKVAYVCMPESLRARLAGAAFSLGLSVNECCVDCISSWLGWLDSNDGDMEYRFAKRASNCQPEKKTA
jgi:hypothetical protein